MRKTLPRVLAVIVVFLLLAWGAVYVITDTGWGREQVRKRGQLEHVAQQDAQELALPINPHRIQIGGGRA